MHVVAKAERVRCGLKTNDTCHGVIDDSVGEKLAFFGLTEQLRIFFFTIL